MKNPPNGVWDTKTLGVQKASLQTVKILHHPTWWQCWHHGPLLMHFLWLVLPSYGPLLRHFLWQCCRHGPLLRHFLWQCCRHGATSDALPSVMFWCKWWWYIVLVFSHQKQKEEEGDKNNDCRMLGGDKSELSVQQALHYFPWVYHIYSSPSVSYVPHLQVYHIYLIPKCIIYKCIICTTPTRISYVPHPQVYHMYCTHKCIICTTPTSVAYVLHPQVYHVPHPQVYPVAVCKSEVIFLKICSFSWKIMLGVDPQNVWPEGFIKTGLVWAKSGRMEAILVSE